MVCNRFAPSSFSAAQITKEIACSSARILKVAFDALSMAALVLDADGRVVALSTKAKGILRDSEVLTLQNRRLAAVQSRSASVLENLLATDLGQRLDDRPVASHVAAIIGGRNNKSLYVRLLPLPRDRFDAAFSANTLLILEAPAPRSLDRSVADLLTDAERGVALALISGDRPALIAARRGVSIHTVRTQIKSICAKANVSGQVEFIAKARSSATGDFQFGASALSGLGAVPGRLPDAAIDVRGCTCGLPSDAGCPAFEH